MNRTIKEATVKQYYYNNHDQLREHLDAFIKAYNFAKRLKTLKGLTPYEFIIKTWQAQPECFIVNPLHHNLVLNMYFIGVMGTIAFAVSGIAIAAKENGTLFATFLFAMLPSVGGGGNERHYY